eukprot:TRINITY_DN927_c0_g1_i1.p1 TRINITY_DN927_c0_g1~~TRINITY_DN927_c0_g1_i1.p1  ORF type:complete len:103 (-),score=28.24 TRINITY_DN927_c0_g1_i1:149-457(-)
MLSWCRFLLVMGLTFVLSPAEQQGLRRAKNLQDQDGILNTVISDLKRAFLGAEEANTTPPSASFSENEGESKKAGTGQVISVTLNSELQEGAKTSKKIQQHD